MPWEQVADYAHLESGWKERQRRASGGSAEDDLGNDIGRPGDGSVSQRNMNYPTGGSAAERFISQEEIEDIFERTYGTRAKDKNPWNRPAPRSVSAPSREVTYHPKKQEKLEEYLLVDGYNIIFAWALPRSWHRSEGYPP